MDFISVFSKVFSLSLSIEVAPLFSIPQVPIMANNTTKVHVTALDAIVNVNTLFTAIVFLGISFNSTTSTTGNSTSCEAGATTVKKLVVFEVTSFSFFLFSSLVAQGLKIHISILNSSNRDDAKRADIDQRLLNTGVIGSGIGSALGCVFLMLSMVNIIQIRLGLLSCGNKYAVPTATTMIVLVSSAVIIYTYSIGYAVKKVYFEPSGGKEPIELKEPEVHF